MLKFTGERLIPEFTKCSTETEMFKEHIERYKFASQFVENKIVLDIACGVGYGSKLLAEKANRVFGCDISDDAIKYAKSHYSKENICYRMMDATRLDFTVGFLI